VVAPGTVPPVQSNGCGASRCVSPYAIRTARSRAGRW
jgi:hypothetical protein